MKTFFTCLFLASATIVVLVVGGDLHRIMIHADGSILNEQSKLDSTLQNVNAVLIQAGLTTDEVRRAATEQRTYWRQTSRQTDHLIKEADKNLNESIFPATALLIKEGDAWLQQTGQDMDNLAVAGESSLDSVTLVGDDLHLKLSDPAWPELMGHLNVAALHFQNMTDDGQAMTRDLKIKVHDLTKPQSRIKEIFSYVPDAIRITAAFAP